ncbi:putative phospholipid-transporting ATPase IA [Hypsibius exemplaris]|uniref:Phospholipid-transporting ATPase n=1 Tax=Hypsibius exemplaris TaxID=2072580 RepID=A0A1W0XEE7_HYPEX|nr:putative phospholipid-transporting ATPase IA [Hypsibius exemplaris]
MVFPLSYSNVAGGTSAAGLIAAEGSSSASSNGSNSPTTEPPAPASNRVIIINKQPQPLKFCSNSVSTTKYNALTFLPLFLFESFRRYSNAFFLFIACLQQIPDASPTGHYTTLAPLSFILFVSACKEIFEDTKRRMADGDVNNRKVLALKSNFGFEEYRWTKIQVGDIVQVRNNEEFPSDLVLLASSEPQGICYIETSNLDGETNLKTRLALPETAQLRSVDDLLILDGTIECETPNRHLYDFTGNIRPSGRQTIPLCPDQLLLRGSRLKNTDWVYGVVVFTGHDSKLMRNSKQGAILRLKRSQLDEFANRQVIMMFALLVLICLVSAIGNVVWQGWHLPLDWYLFPMVNRVVENKQNFGFSFLTFVILYNNLIPISLQVTLEMVRFIQTLFISWDLEMYDSTSGTPAVARTSNLNEDLGQVKYIFSDKTGTLTENKMIFRQCSAGGVVYGDHSSTQETFIDTTMTQNLRMNTPQAGIIHEFLLAVSLCHTVVTEPNPDQPNKPIYLAASPDEAALVKAAASLDYTFLKREPNHISVRVRSRADNRGGEPKYDVLNYELLEVLEFTSERKRMSVLVRTPEGRILLMCKGADSVICDRLAPHQPYLDRTIAQLDEFAGHGFRTLCIATTEIAPEFYTEWKKQFVIAATSMDRRKEKIAEACNVIERNLQLIGATAIEDRLQEGVPECIAQLRKADIKVWVLTGDKMETAVNIGHSCNLLTKGMTLFTLNETSLDRVREMLYKFRGELHDASAPCGLIVDGRALHYALSVDLRKDFFDLATQCKAVICCRASPIQKADVVSLVRVTNPRDITLAIGDGANDVAMIQTAHIGVGISGKEGLQAVCASDYAIGQFRFLQRLLLVHGAWSYERISKLILYCYHKNICLYVMQFYFAITSGFSGVTMFERWTIGLYNICFTAAPPFIIGIFDRSCSADSRMRYPILYGVSQRGELFNYAVFWRWIFSSLIHAAVIFSLTYGIFFQGVLWSDGQMSGGFLFGAAAFTYVIVVVCLKAGLETSSWSVFTHVGIWGSIVSWFVFLPIYSKIWPHFLGFGEDFVGIADAMFSSWLFWFGLIFIPITTLLFDVLYKAVNNTGYTSVVDTVRRMESLGITDLDVFLDVVKPRPLLENVTLLGMMGRHAPTSATATPAGPPQQRGYAFSQDEGGAVSQARVVSLYGATDSVPNRERMQRLSVNSLQRVHPQQPPYH